VKKDIEIDDDAELSSKYQDRTDELRASHQTYTRQHPELKTILSDFLQQVMTRRPKKFLPFAASYFSSFAQASTFTTKTTVAPSNAPSTVASQVCVCEEPEPEE
jgi:hypothetical protein